MLRPRVLRRFSLLLLFSVVGACGHIGLKLEGDSVQVGDGDSAESSGESSGSTSEPRSSGDGDGEPSSGGASSMETGDIEPSGGDPGQGSGAFGGDGEVGMGGRPSWGGQGHQQELDCSPACVCEVGHPEWCQGHCLESPCSVECQKSCSIGGEDENGSRMEVDCSGGSTCAITNEVAGTGLEVQCLGYGDCAVDCSDSSYCETRCAGEGNCVVDCAGVQKCQLDCEDGLVCGMLGASFDDIKCADVGPFRCKNGAVVCSLADCWLFDRL